MQSRGPGRSRQLGIELSHSSAIAGPPRRANRTSPRRLTIYVGPQSAASPARRDDEPLATTDVGVKQQLEAGAPLHYVMDQVGHEDSKTTLEIYAHVQKRVSRPQVKRAFEELLARTDVGELGAPADVRSRVSHRARKRAK